MFLLEGLLLPRFFPLSTLLPSSFLPHVSPSRLAPICLLLPPLPPSCLLLAPQLLDSARHGIRGEDHPAGWRWATPPPPVPALAAVSHRAAELPEHLRGELNRLTGALTRHTPHSQLQLQLEHSVAVHLAGWEPDECKATAAAAAKAVAKHGSPLQLAFQCRYNFDAF